MPVAGVCEHDIRPHSTGRCPAPNDAEPAAAAVLNACFFKVKSTILTVQQHSFSAHERMFLWKCQSLWDSKHLDLRGTRTPNLGFMLNALTIWAIRASQLLSHVSEYWHWWYKHYWSKVITWNVDCALATAFMFDTRTDVLEQVSKFFLRQTAVDTAEYMAR